MKMANIGKSIMAVGLVASLTGCFSNQVAWLESGSIDGKAQGVYAVSGSIVERMERENGLEVKPVDGSKVPAKGSALPITVRTSGGSSRDTTGSVAMVNNVFSVCTLGIWPFVKSEEISQEAQIQTPNGVKKVTCVVGSRKWSSFLLPISVLPCPGLGDWRSGAYMDVVAGDSPEFATFKDGILASTIASKLDTNFYTSEMDQWIEKKAERQRRINLAVEKIQEVLSE